MSPFGFQSLKWRSVKDMTPTRQKDEPANICKGQCLSATVHVNLGFSVRHWFSPVLSNTLCCWPYKTSVICHVWKIFLTSAVNLMEDVSSAYLLCFVPSILKHQIPQKFTRGSACYLHIRDPFINTIKIGYKQQILGFVFMPEYR